MAGHCPQANNIGAGSGGRGFPPLPPLPPSYATNLGKELKP